MLNAVADNWDYAISRETMLGKKGTMHACNWMLSVFVTSFALLSNIINDVTVVFVSLHFKKFKSLGIGLHTLPFKTDLHVSSFM